MFVFTHVFMLRLKIKANCFLSMINFPYVTPLLHRGNFVVLYLV